MSTTQRNESMNSFFDGYVHANTSLKEFVDQYDSALRDKYEKEAQADFESFYTNPVLKTHCYFDNGKMLGLKVYEVLFNTSEVEVPCICNLFEHKNILCKHSLYVLSDHMDEIPSQYILLRWRKDFKRKYVSNQCSKNVQAISPVQRYDVLYPQEFQILDEGVISEASYNIVLEGLQELLKKVQKTNDNCYKNGNACGDVETNMISDIAQQDFTGCTKRNDVSGPLKVGKPHDTQLIAIETQHFADEYSTQEGRRQTEHYSLTDLRLSSQGHLGLVAPTTPNFGNHYSTQDNIHLKLHPAGDDPITIFPNLDPNPSDHKWAVIGFSVAVVCIVLLGIIWLVYTATKASKKKNGTVKPEEGQ
ncbi:hypothetical protein HHK36_013696 [Tetracentron sinense]|uniref:Protein FAR1-RELATED SEQUENCE n=1 Tax=Tetracentron sinense TaxID=13715 RepID=A0A835DDK3_TETSI|nr:hypothetical protein HHK36_013696 [Tetracentron sinense]